MLAEERKLEDWRRRMTWRLPLLGLTVIAAVYILLDRLWEVQVAQGEVYVQRLREQTTVPVRLSPARGEILDRNGLPLARNRSSFDIDIYLDELVRHYKRQHRGYVPLTDIMWRGRLRTNQPDIVKIVNDCLDPIAQNLGFSHRPEPNDLIRHFITAKELPFHFRADVDFETLARFSEHNLGIPGIDIVARPVREYAYGAMASHILGYVGAPKDKSEVLAEHGFAFDTIGRKGIEQVMDVQLQGKPGSKVMKVNYKGYIESQEDVQLPTVGNSLKLTLDANIQFLTEQALRNSKAGRAAAVVLDANSGDILAMASVPDFNPNDFIPSIDSKKWEALTTDATKPLINRAVSGYPPGSTYKVLIALAALKSGAITPNTIIYSPGVVYIANHPFRDWSPGGQGRIAVRDALRMSCNTFFYQVGVKTGIDKISALGQTMGFGEKTGIPIEGEQAGTMPDPAWLAKHHPRERWTSAFTANVSIGQGYVLCTPLQMAVMTAAVANGGTVFQPRLLQSVTDVAGETYAAFPDRRVRGDIEVPAPLLETVREGMRAVVVNGTGRRAEVEGFPVAGKTGTAQAWTVVSGRRMQDNKAWFISYAPYDNPRYASCIMVEGGTGGGKDAAPIAQEIYAGIHKMEQGEPPALGYIMPVEGHFRGASPAAPSSGARVVQASNEESTATQGPSMDNESGSARPRRPSIMMRRSWRDSSF